MATAGIFIRTSKAKTVFRLLCQYFAGNRFHFRASLIAALEPSVDRLVSATNLKMIQEILVSGR